MVKAILELEKIPNNCTECQFYKITGICDVLSSKNNYMPVYTPSEGRREDCPLKLVNEIWNKELKNSTQVYVGIKMI